MQKIERIIMKIIIVQFIFLLLSQAFFHQLDVLPQLHELAKYEGVSKNTVTEILETLIVNR